jgi:hypothetical protein
MSVVYRSFFLLSAIRRVSRTELGLMSVQPPLDTADIVSLRVCQATINSTAIRHFNFRDEFLAQPAKRNSVRACRRTSCGVKGTFSESHQCESRNPSTPFDAQRRKCSYINARSAFTTQHGLGAFMTEDDSQRIWGTSHFGAVFLERHHVIRPHELATLIKRGRLCGTVRPSVINPNRLQHVLLPTHLNSGLSQKST